MLSDALKDTIQSAYRTFLKSKELKARYGQRLMIAEVARTLGAIQSDSEGQRNGESHVCVVEAGTGTGKTVSYVLATVPIAQALGKRVVISTATVALQEQIVLKDIPDILTHSGLEFSFTLAKGRSRYLCPSRLESVLQDAMASDGNMQLFGPTADDEAGQARLERYRFMAESFNDGQWNGERDAWPEVLEQDDWRPITTEHRQCTGRNCPHIGHCPFFEARRTLDQVDVIVANHDLVLADLSLGGGYILPKPGDTIYIFDEAHHLPDKAISHFAGSMRMAATLEWLDQLHQHIKGMASGIGHTELILKAMNEYPELAADLREKLSLLGGWLESGIQFDEGLAKGPPQYRFEMGRVPEFLQEQAEVLRQSVSSLVKLLERLFEMLRKGVNDELVEVTREEAEHWYPEIASALTRAEALLSVMTQYAVGDAEDEPPIARWLNRHDGGMRSDMELAASPILADRTLRYYLWSRCYGAVMTSATLTALGKFDRISRKAGIPDTGVFAQVPSPFDYANAGVLAVPRLQADPKEGEAHAGAVIEWLDDQLNSKEGTLVLFASWWQMEKVIDGMPPRWEEMILAQGSLSKQEILRQHKERIDCGQGSIIFGLASFAEGVDLPGSYLTHVVITKIPFAPPDSPVEATRSEWIEARGGNPFIEVTVPDASLRLIQAAGRLLRSESDTGRVTILDRRLLTQRYGKALINALPPFKRELG